MQLLSAYYYIIEATNTMTKNNGQCYLRLYITSYKFTTRQIIISFAKQYVHIYYNYTLFIQIELLNHT